MRALIFVPIALFAVAALGLGTCKLMGVPLATRELIIAVAICLIASALATVPLILVRGYSQFAVSQAGLAGTVMHLMTTIGAGGVAFLKLKPGPGFIYWLGGMYWTSLIVLVVCIVKAVHSAPVAEAPKLPTEPKN